MLEKWKDLNRSGDKLYLEKNYQKAVFVYKNAIHSAQDNWLRFATKNEFFSRYTMSCRNLANCLQSDCKSQEAQDQLRECYFKLTSELNSKPKCNHLKSLVNFSYRALASHIQSNGCLMGEGSKTYLDVHSCNEQCNQCLSNSMVH